MAKAKSCRLELFGLPEVRREIVHESQLEVASVKIGFPQLGLYARTGVDHHLQKGVVNPKVLVVVVAVTVGLVGECADAVGKTILNARLNDLAALCVVIPDHAVGLEPELVAHEQRIELVEGWRRGTGS